MKKDIYIIKNKINNKWYVGQAIDSNKRFLSHCKSCISRDKSLIDFAIRKYGKDNFYYEILESQIENYNEREIYWIKTLNTLTPNGYNIQKGGNTPPHNFGINHSLSKIKDISILNALRDDLSNTKTSLNELAKKYNITKRIVIRINQGVCYRDEKYQYPLRKTPNITGKLTTSDVKEIINILKTTYRQYEDIAHQFGVNVTTIKNINTGVCDRIETEKYPIRIFKNSGKCPLTVSQVKDIIYDIKYTKQSLRSLAKKYNVNNSTIYGICNGSNKRFRQPNEKYPLRPY